MFENKVYVKKITQRKMKKMSSEEIKGIAFSNGLQGVAKVKGKNKDGFYEVENFLNFEITIDEQNKTQNLKFGMPTYFF